MKTLETMTKEERSLLLFLETRAVDNRGRVDTVHMNKDDMKTALKWNHEGFIQFGRIASEHVNSSGSHWCKLGEDAWRLVAEERKSRADRMWKKRLWLTTEEKHKITI